MNRLITFALAAFLVGCPAAQPQPTPGPNLDPRLDPYPATTARAKSACDGLRAAGCREGQPTKGGIPCEESVLNAAKIERLPLECWAKQTTRAGILDCGGTRCLAVEPAK